MAASPPLELLHDVQYRAIVFHHLLGVPFPVGPLEVVGHLAEAENQIPDVLAPIAGGFVNPQGEMGKFRGGVEVAPIGLNSVYCPPTPRVFWEGAKPWLALAR